MPKTPPPVASQHDIEQLAELIGVHYDRTEQRIADLQTHVEQWKHDLLDQCRFTVEEIRREMGAANRDEIQMLKDRLDNVEQLLRRMALAA